MRFWVVLVNLVFVSLSFAAASPPWNPFAMKKPSHGSQLGHDSTIKFLDPAQRCLVKEADRVTCGELEINASRCDDLNCCFDGQVCYYGKMVTVQCTRDAQFVVVVARDATLPRISLDSVSLLGGGDGPCAPADYTGAFAIYQFPVTACGTNMMVQNGYVIYENRMISSYEVGVGPLGSITRDSYFEIYFQCRYSAASFEAVAVELLTHADQMPVVASGPLRVELRLANGQCSTKGCVEEKVAFTSYYSDADYPVTKILREPVYVEVRVIERSDPNLVLVLDRCWATSTTNPFSLPQWDLLVDGCPYQDDHYLTKLVSVDASSGLQFPSHYRRFILKMFTFVEPDSMAPLQETIFIHCSTAVCVPSPMNSCQPQCSRQRRDIAAEQNLHPASVVSSEKVIYTQSSLN